MYKIKYAPNLYFKKAFPEDSINSFSRMYFVFVLWHFDKKKIIQVNSTLILSIDGWGISCEISLRWMSLTLTEDKLTSVKDNGLVPSGNRRLPVPVLTQIYVAMRSH